MKITVNGIDGIYKQKDKERIKTDRMAIRILTHRSLASFLWDIGKKIAQDEMPHSAASHLRLFSLLIENSS